LSNIVGGGFHAAPLVEFTSFGNEIEKTITFLRNKYKNITFDKYVIMPNHIHLLIVDENDVPDNPDLSVVIRQLKTYTNKRFNVLNCTVGEKLWQIIPPNGWKIDSMSL
jgi:REP element-mobilizing transposase RayT